MFAVVAGGACNTLVHVFARVMPETEYGLFGSFLQSALPMLGIPAIGLQVAFAQLTAAAVTDKEKQDLSATIRGVCIALAALWVVAAVLVAVFHEPLLRIYAIGSPAALVVLMSVALLTLLQPVLAGVLQGRQDFLWFGWVTIFASIGRVAGVAVLLMLLGGQAIWAMCGVLIGAAAAFALALWRTRESWSPIPGTFSWRALLRKVGPLTVALGAVTTLSSLDAAAARHYFEEASGAYVAAGAVGRGLIFLAGAVTTVMFPRIVSEAARSEKSTVLLQALGLTLGVGALSALLCTLMPELPLRFIQGAKYVSAAPLVPWFAWCLVPLTMATALVNNLLARGCFWVAVPLAAIAGGYWLALRTFHSSLQEIIFTMGCAATTAFLAAIVATWLESIRRTRSVN